MKYACKLCWQKQNQAKSTCAPVDHFRQDSSTLLSVCLSTIRLACLQISTVGTLRISCRFSSIESKAAFSLALSHASHTQESSSASSLNCAGCILSATASNHCSHVSQPIQFSNPSAALLSACSCKSHYAVSMLSAWLFPAALCSLLSALC